MGSGRDLAAAYRQSVYRVYRTDGPLDFRPGERSPALRDLLRSHAGSGAAFITAHNPGSRLMPREHNNNAQAAVAAEDSLLLVGIDREAACSLGRRFGQNALVWIGHDGSAELVWLS